jgi:hypothetical protein
MEILSIGWQGMVLWQFDFESSVNSPGKGYGHFGVDDLGFETSVCRQDDGMFGVLNHADKYYSPFTPQQSAV